MPKAQDKPIRLNECTQCGAMNPTQWKSPIPRKCEICGQKLTTAAQEAAQQAKEERWLRTSKPTCR